MRRVLFTGFALLTLLAPAPQAFSQVGAEPLTLKLAADEPAFSEKRRAKIRLRVENRTGQAIGDERTSVSFYLSAHGTDLGPCTNTDCFSAVAFLSKRLKGGQVGELEFDLAALQWKPLITSIDDPRARSMFKVVPPGEYHLFMRIVKRTDKGDTRTIDARSNALLIKVDGQR